MRKGFLLIFILIVILLLATAGVYFLSWQKEKAMQKAFAVPTPSKDIDWVIKKNVIEKEAIHIVDNQNEYSSKSLALRGAEYSFIEVVEDESERYSQIVADKIFANFDRDWFSGYGWYKNVTLNKRYRIHSNDATGVLGYTESYFKIFGTYLKVVALRKDIENTVKEVSKPPFTGYKLNYPFHVKYTLFISDVVSIKTIIPEPQ